MINIIQKLPKSTTALTLSALLLSACGSPDGDDGDVINEVPLFDEDDIIVELPCADAGVGFDTCILDDYLNPFRNTATPEFNVNDPDAETKFVLANELEGPKQRFYFWATAQARFPSGENQWYVAQALHELWDAQREPVENGGLGAGDPIIQEQALKAYRSLLDNHFGSVTFFIFCWILPDNSQFCSDFPPPEFIDEIPIPFSLNELVAEQLYFSPDFDQIVPNVGDPSQPATQEQVRQLLGDWGYRYVPCTDQFCTNGVLSVNVFP